MDLYLIKERAISSSYSSPLGMSTYIHLNHWLDVVARQLSTLDNSNANLDNHKQQWGSWTNSETIIFEQVPLGCLGWQIPDTSLLKHISGHIKKIMWKMICPNAGTKGCSHVCMSLTCWMNIIIHYVFDGSTFSVYLHRWSLLSCQD